MNEQTLEDEITYTTADGSQQFSTVWELIEYQRRKELDEEWRKMWPKTTCPDCGHESHEGYDLICCTPNCDICGNVQCLRYTNRPIDKPELLPVNSLHSSN